MALYLGRTNFNIFMSLGTSKVPLDIVHIQMSFTIVKRILEYFYLNDLIDLDLAYGKYTRQIWQCSMVWYNCMYCDKGPHLIVEG